MLQDVRVTAVCAEQIRSMTVVHAMGSVEVVEHGIDEVHSSVEGGA